MPIPFPLEFEVMRVDASGPASSWTITIPKSGLYTAGVITDNEIVLDAEGVAARHLIFDLTGDQIEIRAAVRYATFTVDGDYTDRAVLTGGEIIAVPGHQIMYCDPDKPEPKSHIHRVELSYVLDEPGAAPPPIEAFPGADFLSARQVSVEALRTQGRRVEEIRFAAVGGGIGSFAWVDHLRIYGIPAHDIRVFGIDPVCYSNYQRYCANSQIPDYERLRSNSQSTPDNIWGFPGYASREALSDLARGRFGGLRHIFQVFGEPTLAESFTPRAGRVYASLDREMARIGWAEMFTRARAIALRQTDDGRYAIALREISGSQMRADREVFVIADQVHLATGYPTTRFVDDFRGFVASHPEDRHLVANAYEDHDRIYQECEATADARFVAVRGRGIVASRVIQRLTEARAQNPNVQIIHSIRTPLRARDGAKWGWARRVVRGNVEVQPFNWPKAAWSGDLRQEHEAGGTLMRSSMLRTLGGTTTADRRDWQEIIQRGGAENWYRPVYGSIAALTPHEAGPERRVQIEIETPEGHRETVNAHFLIDCTGLIGDITRSPFLEDLLTTYALPRNRIVSTAPNGTEHAEPAGLFVSDAFEIETLRNETGRVWASGTITAGGPYLAVDSFLGLQFAAYRAVESIGRLSIGRSIAQWIKWCRNVSP